MEIIVAQSAKDDLTSRFAFYECQEKGQGHYFLDCMLQDIAALAATAGIHRQRHGLFCALAKHHPYQLFYSIENGVVYLWRILDSRRSPDWIRNAVNKRSL
ncbi:MAG TPA: type II toxin-antitoxin system RelE/ParE family toxin [Prosthecobacter sp.]